MNRIDIRRLLTVFIVLSVSFAILVTDSADAAPQTYAYNTADELVIMRGHEVVARTQMTYTPKYRGAVWTLDGRYIAFIADDGGNGASLEDRSKRTLVTVDSAHGSIRRSPCPYCTSLAPIGGSTMLISEEDPDWQDAFGAILRMDLGADEPSLALRTTLPELTQVSFLAGTTEGVLVLGIDQRGAENYYLLQADGSATLVGTKGDYNVNKNSAGKPLLRGIRQAAVSRSGDGAPIFAVSAEFKNPDGCATKGEVFILSPSTGSMIDTDMSPVMPGGLLADQDSLVTALSIWWGQDRRLHAAMVARPCDDTPALSSTTGEWVLDGNRWVQVSQNKLYSVRQLSADTRLVASGEPDYRQGIRLDIEAKGRRIKLADDIVHIAAPVLQHHRPAKGIYGAEGVCTAPCRITSQVTFEHPVWGRSTLLTTVSSSATERDANIAVVDSSGKVTWHHHAGDWEELKLAEPPRDKTGHILINFNPGRYNGIIVLEPVADGFASFGTLLATGEYNSRFYNATLSDKNADGIYEVDTEMNNCEPTCAEGTITRTTYRWNGTDYADR